MGSMWRTIFYTLKLIFNLGWWQLTNMMHHRAKVSHWGTQNRGGNNIFSSKGTSREVPPQKKQESNTALGEGIDKELEANFEKQELANKRLSGAQQRKFRKAEALVAGEPIIPRKRKTKEHSKNSKALNLETTKLQGLQLQN